MSVRVMTAVWAISLPDSEKLVLLALADCANDEGGCWPSMATLAVKCSKSDRTIQGAIKSLVSKGHLSRAETRGKGCSYTVHPRSDCGATPEATAPRSDCAPPPKPLRETPEAASDKPSMNRKEPSNGKAHKRATPALKPEQVIEAWNTMADQSGVHKARLTPERRKKLSAFIRRHEVSEITEAIWAVPGSPFLCGENDRGWRADLDFFLRPARFIKILEGSYGA